MYLQIGPNPQRHKAKGKCSHLTLFCGKIKNLSNLDGIQCFKELWEHKNMEHLPKK